MKQYRITSENFVQPTEDDAVMHPDDLAQIQRLAGIVTEAGPGMYAGVSTPQATESGTMSPVGSNITHTAAYRNQLLEKYQARPGDELWFMINFEPVRGLGEAIGHLEEKIEAYLKKNPDKRPENRPRLPGQ